MNLLRNHAESIDVWLCRTNNFFLLQQALSGASILSRDEIDQAGRFMFEKDQRRYLVTRAAVRSVLSCYASVLPAEWQFGRSAQGRPQIANRLAEVIGLNFNISHTDHLIAIGISRNLKIGIDIEFTSRSTPLEVSEIFSHQERAMLENLDERIKAARFWDLWVLKESYAKARGIGLSLPFDRFSFSFDSHGIKADFDSSIGDSASRWQFSLADLGSDHRLAVCIERGNESEHTAIAMHFL